MYLMSHNISWAWCHISMTSYNASHVWCHTTCMLLLSRHVLHLTPLYVTSCIACHTRSYIMRQMSHHMALTAYAWCHSTCYDVSYVKSEICVLNFLYKAYGVADTVYSGTSDTWFQRYLVWHQTYDVRDVVLHQAHDVRDIMWCQIATWFQTRGVT